MKKLALLLCCVAASMHAQRQMDAPSYELGVETVFDTTKGHLVLPSNFTQLFVLPTSCKQGEVEITQTGFYFCSAGGNSWNKVSILDSNTGGIPSSNLPDIGTLPGTIVQRQFPTTINANLNGNATTATAFQATPALCAGSQYATGVDSHGNAACQQVQWSQLGGVPALVLQSQLGVTVATLDGQQHLTPSQIPAIDWSHLTNVPLATVAYSGNYPDLNNKPSIPTKLSQLINDLPATAAPVTSVNGLTGDVVLSIPTNDNQLSNGAGYITLPQSIAAAPVQSVNGKTGAVSIALPTDDAQLSNGAGYLMQAITTAQSAGANRPQQARINFLAPFSAVDNPGNGSTDIGLSVNIPTDDAQLTNGAGYVTAAQISSSAPVRSVNGLTGDVVLSIPSDDITLANGANYITAGQAPVQSVNGKVGTVSLAIPADDAQLTNGAGYVTAASAPVTSVNGQTGAVALTIPTDDAQLGNSAGYITSANITAAAPVRSVNGKTGDVFLTIPTDDSQIANTAAYITASGAYSTVKANNTALAKRSTLNVIGQLQAVDNPANGTTDLSLSVAIPTNDNQLTNGAGYITAGQAPVLSVNQQVGNVVLSIPTKTSQLTNDSGFITSSTNAVTSVNGLTGAVSLTIPTDDTQIGNGAGYVNTSQAAAAAPVQSVNGNTGNVSISVPTKTSQLTNDSGFITSSTNAVTSVNGLTGAVTLSIPTDDAAIGNSAGYITAAQVGANAPVKSVNGLTGVVVLSIPTDDSQIANGAGYLTPGQAITTVQNSGASIAQSTTLNFVGPLQAAHNSGTGSNDVSLSVAIPTKTSQLTNDSGFITSSTNAVTSVNGLTGAVVLSIPTKTSDLTNDALFITAAQAPVQSVNGKTGAVSLTIPTDDSQIANSAGYITSANAPVISVNGFTGVVTLPIPTKTSQLTNDSLFVTSGSLATVAFTGNYNDLTNKPAGSGTSGGTASGDLSGTYPSPTVVGIKGVNLASLGTGVLCSTAGTPSLCGGAAISAALGYTPENAALKGAANGYVPLDSTTHIPQQYMPASGSLTYAQVIAALGFTPENIANKGAVSGYAPLDANDKIPAQYLPTSGALTAAMIDAALGYVPIPPSSIGVANGIVPLDANATIPQQYMPASGALTKAEIIAALGYTPEDFASKGVANGYAALGNDGFILAGELGSIPAPSIGTGVISNTEFSYLDGATSNIQAQLNAMNTSLGSGVLLKVNNLSDVPNKAIGLSNLGGASLANSNSYTGQQFFNQAVYLYGGGAAGVGGLNLSRTTLTPGAPIVTPATSGSTTYAYYISAYDANGGTSLPSPVATVTNGPDTISFSSYNIIDLSQSVVAQGAAGYYIYRSINGGPLYTAVFVGPTTTFLDNNNARYSNTPVALPTENGTGGMQISGPARLLGAESHGIRLVTTSTDTASQYTDRTLVLNGVSTESLPASIDWGGSQEFYIVNIGGAATISGNGHSIWNAGSTSSSISIGANATAILIYDPNVTPKVWRQIK